MKLSFGAAPRSDSVPYRKLSRLIDNVGPTLFKVLLLSTKPTPQNFRVKTVRRY